MPDHPGIVLRERFLEPLGITASALARGLGVNRSTVSRLLAGGQPLTVALAARLGAFLQVPGGWFLAMQAEYDAARIASDPNLTHGVVPWSGNPDVLLTPRGVLWLDAAGSGPEGWEAADEPHVRELENGALVLEGPRSP